ncbi:oligosaccharide repeat unit polymerase [Metaplanococcus flavidus]
MGIYSTVIAFVLGFMILFNEMLRRRNNNKQIEILTIVNIIYFLCFSLVPILVYFYFENLHIWTQKNDINEIYYLYGSFLSFIVYILIIFSYSFTSKLNIRTLNIEENPKKNFLFAMLLFGAGCFFLLIFIQGIGGFSRFLETNTLYRSGDIEVSSVAFARNLALFIPFASHIFYYNLIKNKNYLFSLQLLMTISSFIVSLLIYYNRAGRLSLLIYLATFFVIYNLVTKKRIRKYLLIFSPIILWFIMYGKSVYNIFFQSDRIIMNKEFSLEVVLSEFVFPFYTIANTLKYPFFDDSPRFFIDFLIAFINLLPSALIPFDVPKNVTQLNTESFGDISGIPIDIISLGYHSFGLAGVFIIAIFFGVLVRYIQEKFSLNRVNISVVFYAHLLFFLPLRVPYAEPTNFLKGNFALLVSLLLLLLFYKKPYIK